MKLYFILSVIVFIVAISSASVKGNEFNNSHSGGVYADTTLKCPVTGDDIPVEPVMFRYIDKDVKFCNDGCVMAFKKEPAKYSEHVKCMPCNDDDGKHNINTTHNGIKYYFCGNGCKGKFDKDPEAYIQQFSK